MSENRSVLTIEGMDRSDCHVYTCDVWNEHSRENASEFVNFTFCGEVARQTHASTNLGVLVGVPVSLIAIAIAIAIVAICVCLKKPWSRRGSGRPCADTTTDIPMREIAAAPSHSVTESDGAETDPSVQQALLPNPSVPTDMLDAHQ